MIKPALTDWEWHIAKLWAVGKMIGGHVRGKVVLDLPEDHRHASAALALYDQPFGFTREDVKTLRLMAEVWVSGGSSPYSDRTRSLADRIEALLPPE